MSLLLVVLFTDLLDLIMCELHPAISSTTPVHSYHIRNLIYVKCYFHTTIWDAVPRIEVANKLESLYIPLWEDTEVSARFERKDE